MGTISKKVQKVGNNLSDPFDAKQGFRQGDAQSCDFFNIFMEKIICAAHLSLLRKRGVLV